MTSSGETRISDTPKADALQAAMLKIKPGIDASLRLSLLIVDAVTQLAVLERELAATRREGWVWEPLYPTQDAFDAGLSQLPKGTTSLNLQACWNAMVKVMQRDYHAPLAAAPKEGT